MRASPRFLTALLAGAMALPALGPGCWAEEDDDEPGMGHPGRGRPGMGPHGEGGPHGDKMMDPPMLEERFLEKLDEHLKLKESQRGKIKSALESVRPGMKKRMEELKGMHQKMMALQKEVHESMRDAKEKIRAELDNEQKERFDMMMMRMMMQKRRGRGGKGPGGWGPGMPPGGPGGEGEGMPPWMKERRPGGPGGDERDMPPPEMWHEKPPRGG